MDLTFNTPPILPIHHHHPCCDSASITASNMESMYNKNVCRTSKQQQPRHDEGGGEDKEEEEEKESYHLNLKNLSKVILPPLGISTNSQLQVQSRGWIISPMDSRYRYFSLSLRFLYIYICMYVVYLFLWLKLLNETYVCIRTAHRFWEFVMVTLVAYSLWVLPFEMAFMNSSPIYKELYIVDNIVDIFFAIDIVITFFLAYIDRTSHLLVRDSTKIATRFVIDIWLC